MIVKILPFVTTSLLNSWLRFAVVFVVDPVENDQLSVIVTTKQLKISEDLKVVSLFEREYLFFVTKFIKSRQIIVQYY